MQIKIDDRKFESLLGSDAINDGMYIEINEVSKGSDVTVLFAFRSNKDRKIVVTAYQEDLPFELIDTFIKIVRSELIQK